MMNDDNIKMIQNFVVGEMLRQGIFLDTPRNVFTCPLCHMEHPIDECAIDVRNVKSEYGKTTVRGRMIVQEVKETYRYVRICRKCEKKQRNYLIILLIIAFVVPPVALIILSAHKPSDGVFGTILAGLFIGIFVSVGLFWVYENIIFKIDYDQAFKDNALLSRSEIYEYERTLENKHKK